MWPHFFSNHGFLGWNFVFKKKKRPGQMSFVGFNFCRYNSRASCSRPIWRPAPSLFQILLQQSTGSMNTQVSQDSRSSIVLISDSWDDVHIPKVHIPNVHSISNISNWGQVRKTNLHKDGVATWGNGLRHVPTHMLYCMPTIQFPISVHQIKNNELAMSREGCKTVQLTTASLIISPGSWGAAATTWGWSKLIPLMWPSEVCQHAVWVVCKRSCASG